jgi:hypothetical protein
MLMRASRSVAFLTFAALAVSCGKKEQDFNKDKDVFAESTRESQIVDLKKGLGINVVVDVNGYESEYLVNRILRFLAAHSAALKPLLDKVVEIRISNSFGIDRLESGKVSLRVAASASDKNLRDFFSDSKEALLVNDKLEETEKKLGVSLVDFKGMTLKEAEDFSARLTDAALGLDFAAAKVTTLQVGDRFGIGHSFVAFPFTASKDEMQEFLVDALAYLKILPDELKRVSEKLKMQVAIQPGTLVASEVRTGLMNLETNTELFAGSDRVLKPIMVGRRFESEVEKVRAAQYVLVDYRAGASELKAFLAKLDRDYGKAEAKALAQFRKDYIDAGIVITGFDEASINLTTDTQVEAFAAFSTRFRSAVPPRRMQSLKITALAAQNPGNGEPFVLQSDSQTGTAKALVDYARFAVDSANAALAARESLIVEWRRIDAQKAVIASVADGSYSSLRVLLGDLDGSSDATAQKLTVFLNVFRQVAPEARLREIKVHTIRIGKGANTTLDSVLVTGGELKVDPYLATEDTLETALKMREKELEPTPTPTPTPDPTPSATPKPTATPKPSSTPKT